MRVTLLGTGASHGIPVIACDCIVCTSDDPRNRRTRASALIEVGGRTLLIDTTPELRFQATRHGIRRVDAILYTHYHADHTHGIDDVKAFNAVLGEALPCYGNQSTADVLGARFDYAFVGTPWVGFIPHLTFTVVDRPFDLFDIPITPVELQHGRIVSTGWRIGSFAYLTDANAISSASLSLLAGLDVMVIDGLRERPHPTHFSIPEAVAVARALGPRRTLLTHLTHEVEHATVSETLPPGVELGYDELTFELPDP
ncbi:MAG: MBL fold metallo-hydrolase [Chloroflexota bacterium]|nr:MBL fold metallo-hydrolase [Chloroflexota bacterium]